MCDGVCVCRGTHVRGQLCVAGFPVHFYVGIGDWTGAVRREWLALQPPSYLAESGRIGFLDSNGHY